MKAHIVSVASMVSLEELHSGLCTVEDFITNADEQRLLYRRYDPDTCKSVAQLCIVHGFGEHSGRYVEFARSISEHGIVVHTVDMRGFGMSGGSRCQQNVQSFTRDIAALLRLCSKGPGANLPVFLLGHSLGALCVLKYCIDHPDAPLAGVIFSSGLFRLTPGRTKPWIVRKAAYVLKAVSELVIMPDVDFHSLTRDPERIKAPYNDRLCIPLACGQLAVDMLNVPYAYVTRRCLGSFRFPVLLYHGNSDRLTWHKGSELVYRMVASQDKVLELFEGGYHELHQDLIRDKVIGLVVTWILKRSSSPSRHFRKDLVPLPASSTEDRVGHYARLGCLLCIVLLLCIRRRRRR